MEQKTPADLKKEILLKNVLAILSTTPRAIEIMRTQKMMNLKLIERSAKSKKDPSPLVTAMATMGLKFPITVDTQKALECDMPREFLWQGKKGEDYHTHGRTLCKKEAVDWWVEKIEVPGEDVVRVIDLLYTNSRYEVHCYKSVAWGNSRIKFGPPVIERRNVSTRRPIVNIEKKLREQLIKQALFPDLSLPNEIITQDMLSQVKELIEIGIDSKMTLASQIRILLTQMDPRIRYLPLIPGSPEITVGFKHAMYHSNFTLTNCDMNIMGESDSYNMTFRMFMQSIIREHIAKNITVDDAKKIIERAKINNIPVKEVLGKVRYGIERTTSGLSYHEALTTETVHFKIGDQKGTFTHSRGRLYGVTTNFTDRKKFDRSPLRNRCVCKDGIQDNKAKELQKNRRGDKKESPR